ncbi:hypothetical protein B7494_g6930 [Chlorociboria aeruginascens]|nr:hypothetical protein B7494_g6930 [Chlorociboria aeruginascens]
MDQAKGLGRKRKAESQDNERLSKRLSLLNLESSGQKLYVPVEQPSSPPPYLNRKSKARIPPEDDAMHLDDTKHKVYIYNLDDELSDSESSDDGRLVFLPDIQKHLRESRIPASILANQDGELAGMNNQLVLYNVPSSLTVSQEQDSVRKAIIETRGRARAKQHQERESKIRDAQMVPVLANGDAITGGYTNDFSNGVPTDVPVVQEPMEVEEDSDAMDLG